MNRRSEIEVYERRKLDSEKVVVSVVIPLRNEEKFLVKCLESLVNQTFPHDKIEVVLIDSASTDKTAEIISEFQKNAPFRIKTLFNSNGDTPTSRNMGIKVAEGDLIFSMIGHSYVEPDHISRCVETLFEKDADAVCGRIINVGAGKKTPIDMGIALALESPFGVGDAQSRVGHKPGWTDNPMLAIYRRELFEHFGLFDERLTRNQDYEFNQRCLRGGAKFWFDPSIKVYYFNRPTYLALWRQFFDTAYWRAYMIGNHSGAVKLRHIVPSVFVTSLVVGLLLAVKLPYLISMPTAILFAYIAFALGFAFSARNKKPRVIPYTFWAFVVMHFSYGIGFLAGVVDFVILGREVTKAVKQ